MYSQKSSFILSFYFYLIFFLFFSFTQEPRYFLFNRLFFNSILLHLPPTTVLFLFFLLLYILFLFFYFLPISLVDDWVSLDRWILARTDVLIPILETKRHFSVQLIPNFVVLETSESCWRFSIYLHSDNRIYCTCQNRHFKFFISFF